MTATSPTSSWLDSLLLEPAELQAEIVRDLSPAQLAELEQATRWRPLPGPQTLAYDSPADILFYGGAAGGGKTDLALGLAGTRHHRSVIFRRIFPSLKAIIDRSRELYGAAATYNSTEHEWTFREGRTVRFGQLQHETDAQSWQGQPHDLYEFDEVPEFTESQFRFVTGWNRTTREGQRCRVLATGNPPTDSDGEWVIEFFGPWLAENHPRPAKAGELRWFMTVKGEDVEMPSGDPVLVDGAWVRPLSRTFIPALLQDNPYLLRTDYLSRLNALPEPLRSKMKNGDFRAGREDSAYQVIPSAWVDAAQARWKARPRPDVRMSAIGVDVARGGRDKTLLARRHENWFDELLAYPGSSTPDGPAVAALVVLHRCDDCAVNIDVIGVGSSPYDCLRSSIKDKAVAMNGAEGSDRRDKSGQLGFVNARAEWYWDFREALDPASGQDLALPPDPELKADLCAPRWKLTARGIQIEAKDCGKPRSNEGNCCIKHRIGRSPDRGDAVVYAHAIKHVPGMGVFDWMKSEAAAKAAAKEKKG